jgi:hypothetical protein
LREQLDELGAQVAELEQGANAAADFVGLSEKYCDITELNASIMHELIERIDIHQRVKVDGEKRQEVGITYRFTG